MRALVDSHIHFWDPDHLHYTWLAEVPAINRPYTPAVLSEAAEGLNLERIVFVQADCVPEEGLEEVRWVSNLAAGDARIQGIVAFAPLQQGEAASTYLAELTRFRLVKGVRRLIQSEALGFSIQPDFIAGVQQLPDFGFSFDLCIMHHQLPDVLMLVEQCPDVSFVLDHFGKPAIKEAIIEPWASHIRSLAAFPNVMCKLSGLVTEAHHETWTPADLQPYIEHILDVFGPNRLMFGGDWPVSELASSYSRWVETAQAALAHLSEHDQEKIFYQNALDFYRL